MLKYETKRVVSVQEWDDLVETTYGKIYSLQQQDGCMDRQQIDIKIPDEAEDYENDTVPEVVNHNKMGVSFKAWLDRDTEQTLNSPDEWDRTSSLSLQLWWFRNFYPDLQMVANDLHEKGLIEAGEYTIDIDW